MWQRQPLRMSARIFICISSHGAPAQLSRKHPMIVRGPNLQVHQVIVLVVDIYVIILISIWPFLITQLWRAQKSPSKNAMNLDFKPFFNAAGQHPPRIQICAPHVAHAPTNVRSSKRPRSVRKPPKLFHNAEARHHFNNEGLSFQAAAAPITLTTNHAIRHCAKQ